MFLGVVNPKTIQEAGGYDHCPLFYEYKLRRFARGFVWFYPDLTLSQLHELHDELFGTFGYSKIVRMRCGYEAIEVFPDLWDEWNPCLLRLKYLKTN